MAARKTKSSLTAYRAKRAADSTPEPFAGMPIKGVQRFVVQHHAARATHYDFRLEFDGVLKSWAVPKGPSPNPAEKRLAVRTEDHPLDYADFEGQIPPGNYGAGSVIVWDQGTWVAVEDPVAGLAKGKLLFQLRGNKLHGKWTLIKTARGEKDWLLIKEKDGHASDESTADYPADSVLSGLTVEQLRDGVRPGDGVARFLRKVAAPRMRGHPRPMLARPGEAFSDPEWLFEIKYDGYRLLAERNEDRVRLISRNGHDLTPRFPEIARALRALPYPRLTIDGEAVVHDETGLPNFGLLQKRGLLGRGSDIQRASIQWPTSLYVFDLLSFDGLDLRALPLIERKSQLRRLLPSTGVLRYCDHVEEQGEALFREAQLLGLEGVIAKRRTSHYVGRRSDDWRKIATQRTDDFVVVGYTAPARGGHGFAALLLAQYLKERLVYRGRVGTGFSNEERKTIRAVLDDIETAPDIGHALKVGGLSNPTWKKPLLVATVRFKQITADGVLRAPVFERLREDKVAAECTTKHRDHDLQEITAPPETVSAPRTVPISNEDKVFWPDEGYTKGDLVDYYRRIAPWLLPYLKDRPVVLTRYPDGIDGKSFFQKDAPGFVPDWIRPVTLWSEQAQREIHYFVIDDIDALVYIANLGTIPLHIWSSRVPSLERPDWCVLDLDPKEAPFMDVLRIARHIHELCAELGMAHYLKTSGSTGLHILVPLASAYTYEQSRSFGELIAQVVVKDLPDIATVIRSPRKRNGKVYIDYLQNRHGQTIAAPFSARPLPCAPVSMPVSWHEVNARLRNDRFTIRNARRRMARLKTDPMAAVLRVTKCDLLGALEALSRRYPS